MATEFNPGGPVERDDAVRGSMNPQTMRSRDTNNWGMLAAAAAIGFLVVVGMMFAMRDTDTTTSNTSPGVTTGIAPSPSNPPPAPGPKGQGESNSTR
jgi:hypothetical protein